MRDELPGVSLGFLAVRMDRRLSLGWLRLPVGRPATNLDHEETNMVRQDKLLDRILRGTSDANIPFADLCQLLRRLGFDERIRGSHHIFTKEDVEEILNLQPKEANAKPYQIKQVRNIILKYKLGGN